jgi:hypothetical protein
MKRSTFSMPSSPRTLFVRVYSRLYMQIRSIPLRSKGRLAQDKVCWYTCYGYTVIEGVLIVVHSRSCAVNVCHVALGSKTKM